MEYASVLRVGGTGEAATIHADSVTMRYGAVMEFDLYSENTQADRIVADQRPFPGNPQPKRRIPSSKHRYSALLLTTIKTGKT